MNGGTEMDVREKLVELLQDGDNPVWGWFPNNATMIQLADYLIAHGVTVHGVTDNNVGCKWISVNDRLPTEEEDSNHRIVGVVNGYNGKIRFTDAEIFVRYCHTENAWWSDDYDIDGCAVEKFYVLPKPPKGE